jgi:hypothetical protein
VNRLNRTLTLCWIVAFRIFRTALLATAGYQSLYAIFTRRKIRPICQGDVISCDADFAWRNDLAAGRNGRRPVGFFLFPGNFVTPPRFLLLTSDAHGQTHLLDFSLIRLNRSRWV